MGTVEEATVSRPEALVCLQDWLLRVIVICERIHHVGYAEPHELSSLGSEHERHLSE